MESLLWLYSYKSSIKCQMQIAAKFAEAARLREESPSLHQHSCVTKQHATEINKTLEVLMDANVAFTAKERQAHKLSNRLQVAELDLFPGKP